MYWLSTRFPSRAGAAALSVAAVTLAESALAHHAMDGQMPRTLWQGLLSGLGHPVIGIDHLAFIVGIGLLAAVAGFGPRLPAVFIGAMLAGLAVHLGGITVPGVELLVAASAALIGLALLRPRTGAGPWLEGGAFAATGLFHGYAFAESIIGAEPSPLAAYIAGLIAVQLVIALGAYAAGRTIMSESFNLAPATVVVRALGGAIFVAGASLAVLASGLV